MNLRVCIAGATGWVGRPLSVAVSEADDLSLVGAVSRTHKGNNLRDVIGDPTLDLTISGSVIEALDTPTDVLVDYTEPDAVKSHVMMAISKGVHVVIGTSGLTDEDFVEINQAALSNKVGVIAVGNFAITADLLERFAREAAKHLSHWEIIDYAADTKVDAPSGMTRQLARRLSEIRKPEVVHPVKETIGHKESRGVVLSGSSVHSLRLPSYTIAAEVIFGETDERLTIRYDAGPGAVPYLRGTLLAIREVKNHIGVERGLDDILD